MTIPKINLEPDNVYKSKLHRKAMNSYILIMIISAIGLSSYATAQDDLASRKPVIANAQSITSQEFVQTAEIEPLQVRNDASTASQVDTNTTDKATKLNDWIAKKEPNSPLNNANHDTGKILLEIEAETKVKAEFILAKAYQETRLGTDGVCKRNVGSVGETDNDRKLGLFCQDFRSDNQKKSMDRMEHYQTDDYLYKSLRAIAGTVNNSLLGNSTVLCQLANGYKGCNKDQIKVMNGKWYARNVDHAESIAIILSDITGQPVDLQFSFKLK